MKRSTPRPSRSCACSPNTASRSFTGPPSGPIDPATKTSAPDTSRASRAIFTAASLIAATSSSRYCSASLRRFAPKVFVSMMSAPARMKPRCSESTLSGARMFASSGQRSRATALDTSVPMPPSPTSGGPSREALEKPAHRRIPPRRGGRTSYAPRVLGRAAQRNGDVPLHRRRGIDQAPRGARRGGLRRRARRHREIVRGALGEHGGVEVRHAGRCLLLRVRIRTCSRRVRGRDSGRACGGTVACAHWCAHGRGSARRPALRGHGRPSRCAHRCLRARRAGRALAIDGGLSSSPASSSFATSARTAQGPRSARRAAPTWRGDVSAAQGALSDKPARSRHAVPRSRGGALRARRALDRAGRARRSR